LAWRSALQLEAQASRWGLKMVLVRAVACLFEAWVCTLLPCEANRLPQPAVFGGQHDVATCSVLHSFNPESGLHIVALQCLRPVLGWAARAASGFLGADMNVSSAVMNLQT
jgi:hypothetical protein